MKISETALMKNQISKGLIALFLMVSIISCKKSEDPGPLEAQEEIDLSYGAHAQQTLDVYLPAGRTDTTKVVILLHGGGWATGDKSELTEFATYYRDKGFAVVNMNYRLTGTAETVHPAQQLDIAAVINFVASKAIGWRVSQTKFGIAGVSAGGHLALLYTYAYNSDGRVKTVVSLAGPTNFTDTENVQPAQQLAVRLLLGKDLNAVNLPDYIQASPLARVNALSRPTLLFHGTADLTVFPKQSLDLHNKLTQLGVRNEYVELVGVGHEIFSPTNKQAIFDKIENWLKENIK